MQSSSVGCRVVLQDADISRMQSCSVEHGVALYDGEKLVRIHISSVEYREAHQGAA